MVYIVGAGPGDPELITLKALRRIQEADVIMYDRLVNEELLSYAKRMLCLYTAERHPDAIPFRRKGSTRTWWPLPLMVIMSSGSRRRSADLRSRGEEACELAARGIPFEFVPGVTSAVGASSSAGIPLTHRGASTSVAFVSGTSCHGNEQSVRWDLLAHSVDTLVVYMGVSRMEGICKEMIAHGKPPWTPAAVVEQGTRAEERIITGTLGTIYRISHRMNVKNPALLIIGEVVRVREQLLKLAADAQEQTG